MLSNYLIALIRTAVPVAVGVGANLLARFGFHVNDENVITSITGGVPVVYYAVVRKIEERYPKAGRLLGKAAAPVYPTGAHQGA